jgi:glycosyltransferase involved in cell wall biosynthesis
VPGARSQAKVLAKRLSYPTLLRTFDAALATGARSRDYYLHYDYPDERIFYSPHSVDTEWFRGRSNPAERAKLRSELGVAENEKLVLFAGKLVAFKRPLDVVEAAAIARSRGLAAQVVVAGSGELEGRLRQRAGTLNVPLHYLGFKNQTDMPAVYAAADVLVLPSDARETWGLVCNEALACTTPVIVSDAAGCAPDLAADGAAGRMYPAGDCEACAHALIALFDEPPSPRAIDEVSGRHSVARAADGVMAGLSAVVSRLQ